MRKSKIVSIFIIFVLAILFCINNAYGFSNGDKVKCTKKTYQYRVQTQTATAVVFERTEKAFKENTKLKYIQKEMYEGLCIVEYQGKQYYVKEVNLVADTTTEDSGQKDAAQKVYDEYKNINIANLSDEELKTALDKCLIAKEQDIRHWIKNGIRINYQKYTKRS